MKKLATVVGLSLSAYRNCAERLSFSNERRALDVIE